MAKVLSAVYEDGVFRPLEKPDVSEGQKVRLLVEETSAPPPEEIMEMARRVYADLSADEIGDLEKIIFDRSGFFQGRSR